MNLLSYFTSEENLVALSISEAHISVVRFIQKENVLGHSLRARITLPKDTITAGRVTDAKALETALTQLRGKFGGSHYCIVTLPHTAIFNQVYALPKTIAPEKIAAAATLAESWRVPFEASDASIDSEIIYRKQTYIATQAIALSDATPYFSALEKAGFVPVAAESELVAIARTLADGTAQSIATFPHENSIDIAVFDGALLLFSRSFPKGTLSTKEVLGAEQKRIIDYVEAKFGKAPTKRAPEKLLLDGELSEFIANDEKLSKDFVSWLPAFGALLRSRIPRRDDTHNSIYPMGTEEIYEYQKFFAFTGLIGTLMVLVCLVFLGAFVGMRYAADTLQKKGIISGDTALISTIKKQIDEKEATFNQVNTIISITSALAGNEARWSENIALLRRMQIDGVSVTNVSITNDGSIALVGIARSRAHLNGYRDGIASLPEVADATIPVTGADLRTDIPFSMTVNFSNLGTVYRSGIAPSTQN